MSGDRKTFSKSYELNTANPGTYTVYLTGDVTDADGTQDISTSVTVIVAEKKQEPAQTTTPTQTTQPVQTTQQQPTTPSVTYTDTNKTRYVSNEKGANLRKTAVDGAVIDTLPYGKSVTVTGEGSNGWSKVTCDSGSGYIKTSLLTDTKPAEKTEEEKEEEKEDQNKEKSTNKALKDLVIENYKLSPEFNPDTTKYSVEVEGDVDKLEISPITQDEKAKCDISGNENFRVGNNTVRVTVTAEDGTTRIYTITVTKTDKEKEEKTDKLLLKKLEIKNATLTPNFSADETNYTIAISDPASLKAEDITALAEDEGVEVKIALSDDSENNERLITIMLEKKDGENTQTGSYQIVVKKSVLSPISNLVNKKDNKIYYILGAIIGVLILFIIIIIVLLKKTSADEYDDYDVQDEDELDDNYDYSLKNAIDEANNETVDDFNTEYDEMVENSNVKSQILNPKDYNVFKDSGDGVGVDDETKKYDFYGDDDFDAKTRKRGKHF